MTGTAQRTGLALAGLVCAAVAGLAGACSQAPVARATAVDRHAQTYRALITALGARDPDSLDVEGAAPAAAAAPTLTLKEIAEEARLAVDALSLDNAGPESRRRYLLTQLEAIATRASLLAGHRLPLREELQRLFQLALPEREEGEGAIHSAKELAHRLPGTGSAATRLADYEARFLVPANRLPAVFERALEECRRRTRAQLTLPDREAVTVTYVTGQPWSGFSRFMGDGRSHIEINTQFPLTVDRVLALACHEGYPGHHAFSTVREQALPADWVERSVTPLFSPDAFVAEAVASMASEMVFARQERLAFERETLFPLAGLPARDAAEYLEVVALTSDLRPPLGRVIARYLAADLDIIEASWALQAEALMAQPLATLQFVNRYRGYALAYTAGRAQLEPQLGSSVPVTERWTNYRRLAETRELLR